MALTVANPVMITPLISSSTVIPPWWEERRQQGKNRATANTPATSAHGRGGAPQVSVTAVTVPECTGLLGDFTGGDSLADLKPDQILDTGASHHVIGSRSYLMAARELTSCLIDLPDGPSAMATIEGRGDLPVKFWGDCALAAVHLINRTPCGLLKNKSPIEVLTGSAQGCFDPCHCQTWGGGVVHDLDDEWDVGQEQSTAAPAVEPTPSSAAQPTATDVPLKGVESSSAVGRVSPDIVEGLTLVGQFRKWEGV
ncbi:hypothetical protein LIER_18782 [Lithospermum erythrorhizon]|uniref:Polyprotein n=1 Tax=Lithospermum erythrorhizon TaxID=34254 RepID=A0AAV3QGH4_LITER